MHNFRTYQVAIDLYRSTRSLRLPRYLRDQLDRACSSVVLNLAEGWSKSSGKERRRFFEKALCSLRETQAFLVLTNDLKCSRLADIAGAHCHKLVRALSDG